jgi:hypothetical protein
MEKDHAEGRTTTIQIRLTPELKREVLEAATAENRSITGYLQKLVIDDVSRRAGQAYNARWFK